MPSTQISATVLDPICSCGELKSKFLMKQETITQISRGRDFWGIETPTPRPVTQPCSLWLRCYGRAQTTEPPTNPVANTQLVKALDAVQTTSRQPAALEKSWSSENVQKIFHDVATVPLDYTEVPVVFPLQRDDTSQAPCAIKKHGSQLGCRLLTHAGVFVCRTQRYFCRIHHKTWSRTDFPPVIRSHSLNADVINNLLIDPGYWASAFRLWQEAEDYTVLERHLRSITADRLSHAVSVHALRSELSEEEMLTLQQALLQVHRWKSHNLNVANNRV